MELIIPNAQLMRHTLVADNSLARLSRLSCCECSMRHRLITRDCAMRVRPTNEALDGQSTPRTGAASSVRPSAAVYGSADLSYGCVDWFVYE